MGYSIESKYKGEISIDEKFRIHFDGYRTSTIKVARPITFEEGRYAVFETYSGNFHRVHADVMRRLPLGTLSALVAKFPEMSAL